jgi:glycosyltransferase involved in cell wall biosynthesis
MNSPEVSIIVCIYNAEKYLSRCIDSIIAQTFTHFECILIDDGSTDNSLSICERYRQSDDRIIVIHQENSGVSAARNKGIEVARGKYIYFVDSDDYIQQNMYEKLVAAINDSDTDVVCCGYNENKKPYALCNEDFIFSNTSTLEIVHYLEMRQAFGIVWNKLYKKNILDTYLIRSPVSIKFGDDMLFNMEYFQHIKSAFISSNCFYNYLHDNKNAVTKSKLTFAECSYRLENVSNKFMEIDNNAKSLFYAQLLAKDFKYTIALLLRLYAEKKVTKARQDVINKLKKFYTENNAKNKFTTMVVAITYKMLLYLPSRIFGLIFSIIFLSYIALVKIGIGKPRFINN